MSCKEWSKARLGDVCDTISVTHKLNSDEIITINTSDVLNGSVLNNEYVPNRNLPGQFKKSFCKNDILYSEIRPQNRRFAYVDFDASDYVASTKLMVIRARHSIASKYLYLILSSDSVITQLQSIAETRSGTFPQITFSELSNIEITLPSLEEQYKIAQVLYAIDDKIELNRRINDNLEQQAQAIFKSWFVDFEPFRDGEFVESEMGMIPKGWKIDSIYTILNVIYGYPFKSALFNDNEGTGLVRIRDLKNNMTGLFTTEIADLKYLINPGDVVAGMDAEFKAYLWLGEKAWLNQRVCKFVAKDEHINNLFVLHSVKPLLQKSEYGQVGTTVIHLGKSDIDKYRLIIPDNDTLKSFDELFTPFHKKIIDVEIENRRLSSLRDTLLPKLISGELSVGEAEQLI